MAAKKRARVERTRPTGSQTAGSHDAGTIERQRRGTRRHLPAEGATADLPGPPAHLRFVLIAENLHPKVAQELMGHASIRTTMDVYGHLMEGVNPRSGCRPRATSDEWHVGGTSGVGADMWWALEDLNL